MLRLLSICGVALSAQMAFADVVALQTPFSSQDANDVVLKNDGFRDEGGQAYLQMGFVSGEMAGVWLQVPSDIQYFKVDSFRVLFGSGDDAKLNQVFFQMGIASQTSPSIPRDIENAAQLTAGPYWNDIPAIGDGTKLPCARAGQYIGAALEFAHQGAPSVYRDLDGLQAPKNNTLFAVPGGWGYSVQYGLRGDWILRVVGHAATAEECNL